MDWPTSLTTAQMMENERRGKVRLRPKVLTFVAVRPGFVELGRLLDIGEEGLSFQYLGKSGGIGGQKEDKLSFEVDIFLSDKKYYLPRVPCVLIYDRKSEEGATFPFGLENRHCVLRFRRLKKGQIDQLGLYLKEYAAKK